jgi:dTDP-4-dehydrorhamnose reductase
LYIKVLHSGVKKKTYFCLSKNFVSWHAIAKEAVKKCRSKSPIILEDKEWSDNGMAWDVSDMKNDFDLEFDPWDKITEHLDYYIHLESNSR